METGYYLNEYAQRVNGGDVRCEVLYIDERIGVRQAQPCPPIPDADIGTGTGAWTEKQLAAACSVAMGVTVSLMPADPVPDAPVNAGV